MNAVHLTHKALSTTDVVIIVVYFCIVFDIGFYFSRKERTSISFFPVMVKDRNTIGYLRTMVVGLLTMAELESLPIRSRA